MRKSELLALLWSNEHVERNYLVIPSSKNGKSRTVPLTKEAISVLGKINPRSDLIFPVTHNASKVILGSADAKFRYQEPEVSDLRHEAISRYFEKGLSVPEVALISGHKTVSQLFRYVHVKIPERM